LVRFFAEKNGLVIDWEDYPAPLLVKANRREIKQVILNLIKNAFEAMPKGGRLGLRLSSTVADHQSIVRLRVSDDGQGIDDRLLPNIFTPFFSTKSQAGHNLGLGLSLCYSILKQHNGSISAENIPTGGCAFSVELPLQTALGI